MAGTGKGERVVGDGEREERVQWCKASEETTSEDVNVFIPKSKHAGAEARFKSLLSGMPKNEVSKQVDRYL